MEVSLLVAPRQEVALHGPAAAAAFPARGLPAPPRAALTSAPAARPTAGGTYPHVTQHTGLVRRIVQARPRP